MERIMIIGCGGSGKSTLARQLGEKLNLPVIHLDKLFWQPGWVQISHEEFDKLHREALAGEQWIVDGNFDRTMAERIGYCDTVIYLDMPRLVCLKNWMGRVISNWGHAREDMAEGCAEWFDPEMAGWIWKFNQHNRKRYYELLNHLEDKRVYILKSRREVGRFLQNI